MDGLLTVAAVTTQAFLSNEDNAITRENKKVSEWFGMRLTPGQETGKIKESIEKIKESIRLPEGISFEKPPQVVDDHERKQGMVMLVLSVIFVYMLMAFFFESTLVPLSIIMTIPLAAMGSIGILETIPYVY